MYIYIYIFNVCHLGLGASRFFLGLKTRKDTYMIIEKNGAAEASTTHKSECFQSQSDFGRSKFAKRTKTSKNMCLHFSVRFGDFWAPFGRSLFDVFAEGKR